MNKIQRWWEGEPSPEESAEQKTKLQAVRSVVVLFFLPAAVPPAEASRPGTLTLLKPDSCLQGGFYTAVTSQRGKGSPLVNPQTTPPAVTVPVPDGRMCHGEHWEVEQTFCVSAHLLTTDGDTIIPLRWSKINTVKSEWNIVVQLLQELFVF